LVVGVGILRVKALLSGAGAGGLAGGLTGGLTVMGIQMSTVIVASILGGSGCFGASTAPRGVIVVNDSRDAHNELLVLN
jgi:hypothetical protein